jgi:SOS-response transcriptional repressor LexA
MAQLGARIRQVLSEKNLTQAQLARLVGVKQQTISYICATDSPASTSRYATKIAQVLGVNPSWLQSGEGGQHDPSVRIEMEGVELTVRRVPLVASRDAPALLEGKDAFVKKAGLMTDAKTGPRAFAVEIDGDSMRPLFRPGDRIVVDPDLTAEPGDFVVAQVQGAVTFRKYRARADAEFELAPMNDDWPVVKSDHDSVKVLGVMVEHRSYRNRK